MILEAIKFSNHFYLANLFKIIYVCAIPILFVSILPLFIDPTSINLKDYKFLFLQLISLFSQVFLTSTLIMVINDIQNNKSQSLLNYYFKSLYLLPSLALVSVAAGLLIGIGFFLILPGIYLLGRFIFIQYVVVLEGLKFIKAFQVSQAYARKKAWTYGLTLFTLLLLFVYISIGITTLIGTNDVLDNAENITISPISIFILSIVSYAVFQVYFSILIYAFYLKKNNYQ